ncbi:MAG TPA: ATP-binding protein, partial [Spirochaetota bacterium]|nr:ATP-binding protein [Spirochaetota bacterium]
GDRIFVYRKIKMNRYIFNRTTAVYVELVYDVSILSRYTRRIILYSLFSCIVITAIMFFLATMRMNEIFIKRMQKIIENLKRIKNGDYSVSIDDHSGDEISDISANINLMTKTIQQRTGEISRTNEQLMQMTNFINDIIDSMPSALMSINEKDRITQWNSEAEILSGVAAADAEGKVLWDVVPQLYKYRAKCDEVRQKRIKVELYGEDFIVEAAGRETVYTKNIYIFPFSKERITGVIVRVDDVTELAKKEEQLERAMRAEALGTMAGGLAHDFNNIISGIISTASYLNVILDTPGEINLKEVRSQLDIMRNSGEKAASLVKSLMSFSRRKPYEFSRVDLRKIIMEVSEIASASAARDIDFIVRAGDEESFISGDRTQLEQVILNLVVNAAEAIKQSPDIVNGSGSVSLTLARVLTGDKPLLSPGGYLWHVTVADNGPGIGREELERIFDPFFTTKKDGNGLGLAIVNTIVTRHEGLIEVDSEKGRGTVFNIYFPAIE